MDLVRILTLDDGPARTAALIAWIQSLFPDRDTAPVVVGGAAVELLTGGAYTTGDLDLVGHVPRSVSVALSEAGFERIGRHWIREKGQVFLEFPGECLGVNEVSSWRNILKQSVRIISTEDLLVDRLGAWQYWQSSVDGANAYLLWEAQKKKIDFERLERRVSEEGWQIAAEALKGFVARWTDERPSPREIESWANRGP